MKVIPEFPNYCVTKKGNIYSRYVNNVRLAAYKSIYEKFTELCKVWDVNTYHGLRNILRQLELYIDKEIEELKI